MNQQELSKIEIAKRQVDGAIRAFMLGGDPVVIATIISPASQILRDLNKPNPKALSAVITSIFEEIENGVSGNFWQEFYSNTAATTLKHARIPAEVLAAEKISTINMMGAIFFCIAEYKAHAGTVSLYMDAFARYWLRREARARYSPLIDALDRHVTVHRIDIRLAFATTLLKYSWAPRSVLTGAPHSKQRQDQAGTSNDCS